MRNRLQKEGKAGGFLLFKETTGRLSPKTNMTMENSNHLKMYPLLRMVIFQPIMLVFWGVFVFYIARILPKFSSESGVFNQSGFGNNPKKTDRKRIYRDALFDGHQVRFWGVVS